MNKQIVRNYFEKFKSEPHFTELTLAFLLHEITNLKDGELTDEIIDKAYDVYGDYDYIFQEEFYDDFDGIVPEKEEEIERDI